MKKKIITSKYLIKEGLKYFLMIYAIVITAMIWKEAGWEGAFLAVWRMTAGFWCALGLGAFIQVGLAIHTWRLDIKLDKQIHEDEIRLEMKRIEVLAEGSNWTETNHQAMEDLARVEEDLTQKKTGFVIVPISDLPEDEFPVLNRTTPGHDLQTIEAIDTNHGPMTEEFWRWVLGLYGSEIYKKDPGWDKVRGKCLSFANKEARRIRKLEDTKRQLAELDEKMKIPAGSTN